MISAARRDLNLESISAALQDLKISLDFTAKALVDLVYMYGKFMAFLVTSRRALWLKQGLTDKTLKKSLFSIPFQGKLLFSKTLKLSRWCRRAGWVLFCYIGGVSISHSGHLGCIHSGSSCGRSFGHLRGNLARVHLRQMDSGYCAKWLLHRVCQRTSARKFLYPQRFTPSFCKCA